MKSFAIAALVAGSLLFAGESATNSPVGLPSPPVQKVPSNSQIEVLKGKIQRARIFGAYDSLIDIYKQNGLYDMAASLEREQVPLYRSKRLEDAAIIHDQNAQALETLIAPFVNIQLNAEQLGNLYTGAPIEPFVGCYSGAFFDRDDSLGPAWMDENGQTHRTPAQFKAGTGKQPGSAFMYLEYGRPFPKKWVQQLKSAGVIPHIAWEPRNLNVVQDDQFLNGFARDLRDADWPIFLRYASEMNGAWTPYSGNPARYKEKFRLVYQVIHRTAPRAALIWCVNNPPLGNANDYYPGDDYVDWVGVNFYSVPYSDNRRDRPAFTQYPLALLKPIYERYSARKPIAVCEYAASHKSPLNPNPLDRFAISKLNLVYGALPLLYPRVKMINWFSMDTIKYPTPGKNPNDYDLTNSSAKLGAWQNATNLPHYFTEYQTLGAPLPPVARPLAGRTVEQGERIRFFAKCFDPDAKIFAAIDSKIVFRGQGGGAFEFNLPDMKGPKKLTIYVYDSKNRFQKQLVTPFRIL